MRNAIKRTGVALTTGLILSTVAVPAFAQTTTTAAPAVTPASISLVATTGAKSSLAALLSGNVAAIATVFAAFVGVGLAFRWVRRVAK